MKIVGMIMLLLCSVVLVACGSLALPPSTPEMELSPVPITTVKPVSALPTAIPATSTKSTLINASSNLPPDSDALNGEILFNTFQAQAGFQCATCHSATTDERLIGPGLWNIVERAATRVPGQSAVEYLYMSIVNPGAFVVESYPDHLMPQTWGEIYTQQEIYDIVAYLLTLGG